jgi:hypothetical protein
MTEFVAQHEQCCLVFPIPLGHARFFEQRPGLREHVLLSLVEFVQFAEEVTPAVVERSEFYAKLVSEL